MNAIFKRPSERKVASQPRKPRLEVKPQTNGRLSEAPQSDPVQPITGFFEEFDFFQVLESRILPQIIKTKHHEDPIRVWVPGASTGEEVYSIAICLLEALGVQSVSVPIRLFATNINEQNMQKARAGVFPENALLRVSPDRLRRFFRKENGLYRVTGILRDACLFARHDLTKDPPFSRLDLIRCRDVLSYLEPMLLRQVLTTFHYALRDTGFLSLGAAESPGALPDLFKMVDQKSKLFTKRAGVTYEFTPWSHEAARRAARYVVLPSWASAEKQQGAVPSGQWRENAQKSEISCLREELTRTKQYLEAIIDQYSSINQELKSANEEAVSNMEELHSVNEELVSAKDELQSTNEELSVVNEAMQRRHYELAKLTDDLANLLDGVNIPIVMLGSDRRIRRATRNAERLLHVRAADAGRPMSDIRPGLAMENLDGTIAAVLNEGHELEREVRGEDGKWYSLRLRPYWTAAGKIDGVLLSLLDIHALKESREAARGEERFVSAILDAAGRAVLLVVVDAEGRIVHFNRACQELSGYSLEEVRGKRPWDFLLVPEEIAAFEAAFNQLGGGTANEHENHWVTKDGRRRLITWWNNIIDDEGGRVQYVIGSGIDVTERQQAREQARQSEATVRALLETAAQAIIGINAAGYVVLANATAETFFGYTREEMLDQPLEKLLPSHLRSLHFDHRAAFFERPRNRRMGKRLDVAGLRKDGTEFPAEISLSHVASGEGRLAVAFITDITERKHNEEALRRGEAAARASQQQLRELTAGLLQAQEEERRRVSRELHDDLNQKLAMLAVEVGAIEAKLPQSDGKIREQLQSMEKRLNGLSDDVRRTAYQLHPSVLEHLGLADALETYCSEFSGQEGMPVDFRLRKVPATIPKGVALCLYRVAQEALRNIARHSGATRASVTLAGTDHRLKLIVEDRGRGFDPAMVEGKRGLGLISMKERVTAAGGLLTIEARPGAGTRVQVRIPLAGGAE